MSVYRLHRLSCSACGAARTVKVADSANPVRHPPFLDELLNRSFHRTSCDRCGIVDLFDRPVLWTDVPARLIAIVRPATDRRHWSALEVQDHATLRSSLDDAAPGFVRSWAETVSLRLVFGYEELRDKVVAARAGVDDAVVESLKLPYTDPETASGPVLEMVDDAGLHFAHAVSETGQDLDGPDARRVAVIDWDAYRAAFAERDRIVELHPGLGSGCWVHWARSGFGP